jgi:hypothetical protein
MIFNDALARNMHEYWFELMTRGLFDDEGARA